MTQTTCSSSRRPVGRRRFIAGGAALTALGLAGQPTLGLAAGPEIPVGALVPLTGGGAPYGPNMLKAMQLTVDAINKAGGPMGRPIRLYSADAQTAPDAAVAAAQKLISLNHVTAILGTWSSGVTLAVIPITLQNGIIEMNTSGAPEITSPKNRPLVFRTQPTDKPYGVVMARYAKRASYRKASLMVLNNPFALAVRDSFIAEWHAIGMPGTPASVVYNPGASSYAGELQRATESQPDLLVIAGYTPDASTIAKEAYAANVKAHVMGPGFAFNETFVKNVGANVANGFIAVDGVPPVNSPGFKAFADAFKSATGANLGDNFWAAQAHDQVNLLALAMAAAKSTKGSDVAAHMRAVAAPPGQEVYDFASGAKLLAAGKKINYQGASGPCDFDAEHNIVSDFGVWTIDNGQRKMVAEFPAKELGSSAA